MKMSKFRIAVLVLLVITVVYAVALALSVQTYNEWKREVVESYPYEARELADDFTPFWEYSFHKYYFMAGMILTTAWIFTIATIPRKGKVQTIWLSLIALFVLSSLVLPEVLALETIHIDVLCVVDQEAIDSGSNRLEYFEGALNCINPAMNCPVNDFDIEFDFHIWHIWDSNDSLVSREKLLYDAIGKMSWYWGKMVDGESMELMIVITGQPTDGEGLSYDWERALIVYARFSGIYYTLIHELGHQFLGGGHCGDYFCYMNQNWLYILAYKFCDNCKEQILANRECLLELPPSPPSSSKSGGRPPIAGGPVRMLY